MTDRREAEAAEAASPTLTDTLDRLRADDATVAEFVGAGGLSAFRPLTMFYVAEVVDGHPIQSLEGNQLFNDIEDATAEARRLSLFARVGVFELVTKAVFE